MAGVNNTFTIVMYPWFAMGHLTAFLHLSNKLAARGHRIFFFLPMKTQAKLEQFNLHPDLIKFEPILVPQIQGLPPGTETTLDIPFPLQPLLRLAMDLTRPTITSFLRDIKPHFVFFDFSHWMPSVTRSLGIKSINLFTISPATAAYVFREGQTSDADLMTPPSGFPCPNIRLRTHEARGLNLAANSEDPDDSLTFMERLLISTVECDAIAFRACREMEGSYCEFLENKFNKPVILTGPVVPVTSPNSTLEENWGNWLNTFKPKSVVFCAFGSECRLQKDQFQELLLGLELTGLPFFVALKSPVGFSEIEDALPEGFKQRTQGKGIVHGGWVPQQLILAHHSVGCFVTHCGSGSLSEALVSECQMVLLPNHGDQVINARVVMGGDLRVGIEVEKGDEDGLFTKHGVCRSIKMAMTMDEEDSEIGKEIRDNHSKWREFLLNPDLESQYTDDFLHKLKELSMH